MERIEEYLRFVGSTASESSVGVYRRYLQKLVDYCASQGLKRVTTKVIIKWTDAMIAEGLTHAFIGKARSQVFKYYKWSILNGHAKENPVNRDLVQKLKPVKPTRNFFTEEQYRKTLESARTNPRDYWYGAVLVAWNTGLRISDVAMLKWESLETESEILRIKIYKLRHLNTTVEIPVDPDLFDFLTDLRTRPKYPGNPYVFPDMYQSYLSFGVMTWEFSQIVKKAGLSGLSFHCFRHSFISRMLNSGVDSQIVAAITGLSLGQVATYAHISMDAKRTAMQRMRDNLRAA